MAKIKDEDALNYHEGKRPGKIEVIPTKPYSTQKDLSLAYTPGVAIPCLAIEKNPEDVYKYTAKGNLVAVISNGTAVLGLGDIGTEAGKPVMEGKGILFKIFADVDVFDIEISTKEIDKFVETVKQISPTFGGINLEDIKAPECFEIERRLVEELNIPVMHDDQHGTAIISSAGLLNALELSNKKIENIILVVSGAGAAAISCTKLLLSLGLKKENVIMLDSKGVLRADRTDLNETKQLFATSKDIHTLEEAMKGADVFLGLSKGNCVSKEMIKSMAKDCIVFAMANPNPEISYEDATSVREDIIMATGRSDYPNQVNNVLGFPFIFRGALDVRATKINEAMKIAAVKALAALAKEDVPEYVIQAYDVKNLTFGKNYIIPKPLDLRLINTVSPAVAKAAMESGVALKPITDWEKYNIELKQRLGQDNPLMRTIIEKAKQNKKKIAFAGAENYKILKAAVDINKQGIATPVLIGKSADIIEIAKNYAIDISSFEIIDVCNDLEKERKQKLTQVLYKKFQRNGYNLEITSKKIHDSNYYGLMMLDSGEIDAFISGLNSNFSEISSAAIQIVGKKDELNKIAGINIIESKRGVYFFADTTFSSGFSAESLVQNTVLVADEVRKFNIEPVIAIVSETNFSQGNCSCKSRPVKEAINILHEKYPDILVDGEMQVNFALNRNLREMSFPFSKINGKEVNTLIFPDSVSGSISYKLLHELGGANIIGPVINGLKKSVQILSASCSVNEIVNMASIAAVDAQYYSLKDK